MLQRDERRVARKLKSVLSQVQTEEPPGRKKRAANGDGDRPRKALKSDETELPAPHAGCSTVALLPKEPAEPPAEPPDPLAAKKSKKKGNKHPPPVIEQKLKVVAYWKSLPEHHQNRQLAVMQKFPGLATSASMVCRWRKAAVKFGWDRLPLKLQRTCKEVPNLFKLGVGLRRKGSSMQRLPMELLCEFDRTLESRIHGSQTHKEARELLQSKSMILAMRALIPRFNKRIVLANEVGKKHNQGLLDQFHLAEITEAQLLAQKHVIRPQAAWLHMCVCVQTRLQLLCLVCDASRSQVSSTIGSMWCTRFKAQFRWRQLKLSAPSGAILEFTHPRVVSFLESWQQLIVDNKVNPRLILNYDQIWRLKFRSRGSTLHKEKDSGEADPLEKRPRLRKDVAAYSGKVLPEQQKGRKHQELVFTCAINNARHPHTCVTSLWGDGQRGPLVFVFAEGQISPALASQINQKFPNEVYLMTSGREGQMKLASWCLPTRC